MNEAGTPHSHDDEADRDHCACDIPLLDGEATPDTALPIASGGVQIGGDHIDGCDLDFTAAPPTGDAELPIATGGVA